MSEDLTKKLPKGDENVASILQQIDSRLQRLEQKVEERLYDTRPIWQKVVADIAQVQEGQRQLQDGQNQLSGDVRDIKISMREIAWQVGGISETLVKHHGKNRELEERVRDLERPQQKPTNSST